MNTQQFFSKAVAGDGFRPKKQWEPLIPIPMKFQESFDKYKGYFDEHIATSIPLYREMQLITGQAIVDLYGEFQAAYVVDIAGSEGTWVKAITDSSEIVSAVVDCNNEMKEAFYNNYNYPDYSCFLLESFLEPYEDIEKHIPRFKADVVHAGMAFQFMPFSREACIKEVADNYIKDRGLFLIEEKVITNNWGFNEEYKDSFKSTYYSKDEMELKNEEVVKGMNDKLILQTELENILRGHFNHIYQYYDAGNFVGYACSNYEYIINNFKERVGVIKY